MRVRKDIESLLDRIQDRVPDSTDDFLESLGLQRRRSMASVILPAVGTLVVGAAIGSALGMLFGPRYGYQLMDRLGMQIPEKLKEPRTLDRKEGIGSTIGANATTNVPRPRSEVHS